MDDYFQIQKKVECNPVAKLFRSFRMKHLEIMKYAKPTDKVLDCGCGLGYCLNYLRNKGFDNLYGIDIEEKCLKQCREPKVYNLSATELDKKFPPDYFDIIICYDLIHHLLSWQEYQKAILAIKKVLKKGGYLFIADPTKNFWWKVINWLPKKFAFISICRAIKEGNERERELYNLYFSKKNKLFEELRGNFEIIKIKSKFFRSIMILRKN